MSPLTKTIRRPLSPFKPIYPRCFLNRNFSCRVSRERRPRRTEEAEISVCSANFNNRLRLCSVSVRGYSRRRHVRLTRSAHAVLRRVCIPRYTLREYKYDKNRWRGETRRTRARFVGIASRRLHGRKNFLRSRANHGLLRLSSTTIAETSLL